MTDLKTTHATIKFDFPEATKEILESFSKDRQSPVDPETVDWFYAFEAGPDLTGDEDGRYRVAIYGKIEDAQHRIECGLFTFRQLPSAVEYVLTVAKEGVMHHNTPHEAVIFWKHPSAKLPNTYLVGAGVEMPDRSTRVAIVAVGAPVFLGGKTHYGEIQRPYLWVRADENRIAGLNDIGPALSDQIWATPPGDALTYRGTKMRRLTASELRRFNGFVYEGEARMQASPQP